MTTDNKDRSHTSNSGVTLDRDPSTQMVVVATRFVVRRRRDSLPFLRAALASGREAEAVPGFIGGTVLADLWNGRFWTVSVWASPAAVRAYGSAPTHTTAMSRTQDWAAEAQVERWRTSFPGIPTLTDTANRLGVPAPRRGLVRHLRPHHPVAAPHGSTDTTSGA